MDPSVRFGKPCIAGTRTVADDSVEAVREAYSLSRDQVLVTAASSTWRGRGR